ncbi:hypothetical protein [Erythrobacter rubeus]|uniref:Uncharacterized protein n=1 Tax=Erythrobacter rubeus TaxID=2760803 RepID=A0ABR8KSE1_9SPHN|nr:hypothetical protein [Erythrobacter rubeus]MBD2841036.1 hypothetical protein [Erythrobacter rubeus]
MNKSSDHKLSQTPLYSVDSPELRHLPFLFWLIENHRPQSLVQLGFGDGVAYFAACQAVDQLGPDKQCVCISSGSDENLARTDLLMRNEKLYGEFSDLKIHDQRYAPQFVGKGVDLLILRVPENGHQADFPAKAWRDLLSDRGIVLLLGTVANSAEDQAVRALESAFETPAKIDLVDETGMYALLIGAQQQDCIRELATTHADSGEPHRIGTLLQELGYDVAVANRGTASRDSAMTSGGAPDFEKLRARYEQGLIEISRLGHLLARNEKELKRITLQWEDGLLQNHIRSKLEATQSKYEGTKAKTFNPMARRRHKKRLDEETQLVEASGLFDRDWYLAVNRDVQESGIDPVRHFVSDGAYELRDPGPLFSSFKYHKANPDVTNEGIPALIHYLKSGRSENRQIFKVGDLG